MRIFNLSFIFVFLFLSNTQAMTQIELEKNCPVFKAIQGKYKITESSKSEMIGQTIKMEYSILSNFVNYFSGRLGSGEMHKPVIEIYPYSQIPGKNTNTSCFSDGGAVHVSEVTCDSRSFKVDTSDYKPDWLCSQTNQVIGHHRKRLEILNDGSLRYEDISSQHSWSNMSMTLVKVE